ncbi:MULTISPECIES: helix-turn-helix domain-containing protein [unclassified Mycobacterium]|uniref:TetR/AcrR family transcriptional regulator n=1 Tax=unclassified Mycobacterium TaxID=2642494 RepID=UPI0029C72EB8|nr:MULTISPECIES: helix-turn-helix domain-containing protein [unclassified Mycobacterium]
MGATAQRPTRRTQQQRVDAARRAIVDAALASLADRGYQATTFASVAAASGLSRGGLLHHFLNKTEMVAGVLAQAVAERLAEFDAQLATLKPGPKRLADALDMLYEVFHSVVFHAAVATHAGARHDQALMDRIIPVFNATDVHIASRAEAMFGGKIAASPDIDMKLRFAVTALRGDALLEAVGDIRGDSRTWNYVRQRIIEDLERT